MFRYRIPITDPEQMQHRIRQYVRYDTSPTAAGIHFTEGSRVQGYFNSDEDVPGARGGRPPKSLFSGRFVQRDGGAALDVWVFPQPLPMLFLLLAFLWAAVAATPAGYVLYAIVFGLFAKAYVDTHRANVQALKQICT